MSFRSSSLFEIDALNVSANNRSPKARAEA
jgi:hypothetical protein